MSDTTRPNVDELDDQLTIAETDGDTDGDRDRLDGGVEGDPSTGGSVSEVLPEGLEEPDPPVGIP